MTSIISVSLQLRAAHTTQPNSSEQTHVSRRTYPATMALKQNGCIWDKCITVLVRPFRFNIHLQVWRVKKDGSATLVSLLSLHSGPVTALSLLLLQDSTLELASTSNDSTMCLTRIALDGKEGGSELKDPHWRQDMGGGVALSLHLTRCSLKSPIA